LAKQAKKPARAKKIKDLDPKAKGKGVRGGYTNLGKHASNVGTHAGNVVENVGEAINNTGKRFNRAMNPSP
jgi:hypothetical protein